MSFWQTGPCLAAKQLLVFALARWKRPPPPKKKKKKKKKKNKKTKKTKQLKTFCNASGH